MRRKLFTFTVGIILSLGLADILGVMPDTDRYSLIFSAGEEFEGTICSVEKKDEGYRLTIDVYDEGKKTGRALLSYYGHIQDPYSLVRCRGVFCGELLEPQGRRNPGCFDYRKHLKSLGISAVGTLTDYQVIREPQYFFEKFERFLSEKKAAYSHKLSKGSRGIVAGVLFGDDGYLDEDIYEEFRNNGTAHVLSVSGLHMGVIYSLFRKCAGKTMTKPKLAVLAVIMLTMGTLAGWAIPVIRAVASISLSIYAQYKDKRYDFLTATAAVALVMIAVRPHVIFNAGFQMSFLAVTAIGFFMPHFSRKIPDSIAMMVSANIGLLPYQAYQFNSVSVVSFLANIPVVYLTGILMPLAMADFLLDMAGAEISIIRSAVEAVAYAAVKVNSMSALGGDGAADVLSPPLWSVIMFYLVSFFMSSETFYILTARKKTKETAAIFLSFGLLCLITAAAAYEEISGASVTFVDVGQGDCVHIRAGSVNAMIDGGGSIRYNVGENILKPYLLKNGVRTLDLGIATHLHTDHYKGLEELYQEGMAEKIETGVTAGQMFSLSDKVKILCLWPLAIKEGQDANENCSVFMVTYGKWKILITGDLDEKGEKAMLEHYKGTDILKADILKISHHGSPTGTCDEFLEAVSPKIGVIQVGKNNYGHPSVKIIEKCEEKDIMVLRNDRRGAIGFVLGKDSADFYTMIN